MRISALALPVAWLLLAAGCVPPPAGLEPWYTLTEESFAPIKAGAAKAEVAKLVGPPPLVSRYAGPQTEVWTYQLLAGTRMYLADVTFGPDGRVQSVARYPDPAHYSPMSGPER